MWRGCGDTRGWVPQDRVARGGAHKSSGHRERTAMSDSRERVQTRSAAAPNPAPRPADPRPATGRGQAPATAGTAPSASGCGRVGGAGLAGRVSSRTKAQPGMFRRGEDGANDPTAPGGDGVGWGRRKSLRAALARWAKARRPAAGVDGCPRCWARLPASFPPPGALPGATVPTDSGVKRTYLEPDKQEPLRPGSQSPPGVTGAAPANRRHRREPLQPIPLHSGLRAP